MVKLKQQDQVEFEKAKDLLESAAKELGFIRSLFFGKLRTDLVMPYPKQDPEDAKRTAELLAKLDVFLKEKVNPDDIDRHERIPQEVIDGLFELGIMGMTVPTEYGGGGYSHTAYCRVLERIGRHCASTAVLVSAHQSIGLKALVISGTEEQKRKYLPGVTSGKQLAAFCLTEPEAGSDAGNVQTKARLSEDGKYWIINGEKKFATNAAIAGFLTVMARTPIEVDGKVKDKITAFIVTPDTPGFQVVSPNRSKCGIRGTWQATLKFTDMKVPREQVLGKLGQGLKVALTVLDFGRCTLSAGSIGGANRAMEMAVQHARTRRQFSRPIGQFHLIQQKIARMAEYTFAMESVNFLASGLLDQHHHDMMLETALVKVYCTEVGWLVVDDAMQIMAGEGYMREAGLERIMRDARINRIVEGATEVMTSFIALMGLKGVGEEFEAILKAAKHPFGNFGRLAKFAKHEWSDVLIGASISGHGANLHAQLQGEGEELARLTRRLARRVTRLLAKHKEGILDMQIQQQRLTWAVAEMYATAAVISRLQMMLDETKGNGSSPDLELNLKVGKSFCRHAADRINRNLDDLFRNHDDLTLGVANAVLKLKTE